MWWTSLHPTDSIGFSLFWTAFGSRDQWTVWWRGVSPHWKLDWGYGVKVKAISLAVDYIGHTNNILVIQCISSANILAMCAYLCISCLCIQSNTSCTTVTWGTFFRYISHILLIILPGFLDLFTPCWGSPVPESAQRSPSSSQQDVESWGDGLALQWCWFRTCTFDRCI